MPLCRGQCLPIHGGHPGVAWARGGALRELPPAGDDAIMATDWEDKKVRHAFIRKVGGQDLGWGGTAPGPVPALAGGNGPPFAP